MELVRGRLLDRLVASQSTFIRLIAPAGYGKSTVARQFCAARGGTYAVCDCAGVAGAIELARRTVSALGAVNPERAEAWAREQLAVGSAPEDWRELAETAWAGAPAPDVFIFENVEQLPADPQVRRTFDDLVALRRGGGLNPVTIACSRQSFPIPFDRGLAPHEVLTLTAEDLTFDMQEVRHAVAPYALPERCVETIARLSRGWPIVVMLCSRFAQQDTPETLIARLQNMTYEDLYEYVATELLQDLDGSELTALLACAALPNARGRDLELVLGPGLSDAILPPLLNQLPILHDRAADRYDAHPIVKALVWKRYPDECQGIVRRIATRFAQLGEPIRAAELFLSLGDQLAAASALTDVGAYLVSTPSIELSAVLSSLQEEVLVRFPALWCAAIVHRGYSMPPDEWIRSTREMYRGLAHDADSELRCSVFSAYLNGLINVGSCRAAQTELEEFERSSQPDDLRARIVVMLYRAVLHAYGGRYARLRECEDQLAPLFAQSDLTHSLWLYDVVAPMYLAEGERTLSEQTLDRAWELGQRVAALTNPLVAVHAVFNAWFFGAEERFERYLSLLEQSVTPGIIRGHRLFIDCARGRGGTVSYGYEKMRARCEALLIASGRAGEPSAALGFARAALQAAEMSERPLYRVLAHVVLAELDVAEREQHLGQAATVASTIDAPALLDAVAALASGEAQGHVLSTFASRYRPSSRGAAMRIDLFDGVVRCDGDLVALPPRELGLVMALAREPRWYSRDELVADLFPEQHAESGQNRLYVYLHRLRKRCPADSFILVGPRGVRLHPDVVVDLWSAEAAVAEAPATNFDVARDRSLGEWYLRSRSTRPASLLSFDFFQAVERRIVNVRRALGAYVASRALCRGDASAALSVARQLTADDALDESARELAVRAHLLAGDASSALHEWSMYCDQSVHELGAAPSTTIQELLAQARSEANARLSPLPGM